MNLFDDLLADAHLASPEAYWNARTLSQIRAEDPSFRSEASLFALGFTREVARSLTLSSFRRDPTIGTIFCHSWQDTLRVVIAHELSHVVSHRDGQRGHGKHFRHIYRTIRSRFVNNRQGLLSSYPPEDDLEDLLASSTYSTFFIT